MKIKKRILITGAAGQIGSELTPLLRKKFGSENILASDIKNDINSDLNKSGPFEILDVTDRSRILEIIKKYNIDIIYHMSAILSVTGEKNTQRAADVNVNVTYHLLEAAS